MLPTRLILYYNYLGNFDFLDKELQTLNLMAYTFKLDALSIQSQAVKHQLLRKITTKILVLEMFGSQRFFINKTKKTFSKSLLFELTLRRENLFLFLENCLHTIFLCEYKSLNLNDTTIENKSYFYFNSYITSHFILTSNLLRYSVQFFEFFTLSKEDNRLSFYLIPVR